MVPLPLSMTMGALWSVASAIVVVGGGWCVVVVLLLLLIGGRYGGRKGVRRDFEREGPRGPECCDTWEVESRGYRLFEQDMNWRVERVGFV